MKCAVVTPVGPGHRERYQFCLESIQSAWQCGQGPFTALETLPMWDLDGAYGRSARRNDGIAAARDKGCEWIFFLDADDLMYPTAFADFAAYAESHDAVWGNICEASFPDMQIVRREPQRARIADIGDLLKFDPMQTLQMGHFVRTECAAEVGFDTRMDTGEDFKYYLALWTRFRCLKAEPVFFINVRGGHSSGPRSADGGQWREAVRRVIVDNVAEHGLIADVTCQGVAARFWIDDPFDPVQRHHCAGVFHEQGELLDLAGLVGPGRVVVDMGAGVGNHIVFYGQHMRPGKLFPFEADLAKAALLRRNVALNGLDDVVDGRGLTGSMSDKALDGVSVDFLRIALVDEGLAALETARVAIAGSRPILYAGVPGAAVLPFKAWCAANGYRVHGQVRRAEGMAFLAAPPGRLG